MHISTKHLRRASWEWWGKASKRAMRNWQWWVKLDKLLQDDWSQSKIYKRKKKKVITYTIMRPWDKITVRAWNISGDNLKKYLPLRRVDVDVEVVSYSFLKNWKPKYVVKDSDWDLFTYKP